MYNNLGTQPGVPRPPISTPQPNPFGDSFYGASSGLIRGGLGAYGEKILGSSSEYVQSNVSLILTPRISCFHCLVMLICANAPRINSMLLLKPQTLK